jgi:hypothetical protein
MKKTKVYKYTYDYVKNYIENECKMDWLDLKLLSNEYVKIKNKLIIEDSEHFKFHLSFDNIKISHKRKSKLEKFSPVNIFTLDNIQLYLNQINSGIMLLSNVYINNREKLCFKCKNNHIFERSLDNIFKYSQCLECEGQMRRTTEDFKRQVYNLVGEEYSVLGEFVSVDDPIKIKHNICNSIYKVRPNDFLFDRRCPICAESKGEQKIRHWLEDSNKYFSPQYVFEDCKDKKELPFDFAIFEDKEKTRLKCLIEYDGEGHYDEKVFGKKSFEITVKHDKMKNKYCEINNVELIRIPYWDFDNVEKILKNLW